MTDIYDRATEQEEHARAVALREQARRAGLTGKTAAHSAAECDDCGEPIPLLRREAMPGYKTCIGCQSVRERQFYER